jgi:hypothetical protein
VECDGACGRLYHKLGLKFHSKTIVHDSTTIARKIVAFAREIYLTIYSCGTNRGPYVSKLTSASAGLASTKA